MTSSQIYREEGSHQQIYRKRMEGFVICAKFDAKCAWEIKWSMPGLMLGDIARHTTYDR